MSPWKPEDGEAVSYSAYSQKRKQPESVVGSEVGSDDSGSAFQYQPHTQPQMMCYPSGCGAHIAGQPFVAQGHVAPVPIQQPGQQYYMPMQYPGYQQYTCYPQQPQPFMMAAPAPEPVAAVPTPTLPSAKPEPAPPVVAAPPTPVVAEAKSTKKVLHNWTGRTRAQVQEDELRMAVREGVFSKPADLRPKDAPFDALFWVVELDGSPTLRMFKTIDELLAPGTWKVDDRFGNAYFVREEKKKE